MGLTTLVLGAGVSSQYGYPLGLKLVDEIKQRLRSDSKHQSQQLINDLEAINPYSIDAFLKFKPKYESAIKSTIAEIILDVENPENYSRVNHREDFYRFLFNSISADNYNQYRVIDLRPGFSAT